MQSANLNFSIPKKAINQLGILRDKTMDDKLMYTLNYDYKTTCSVDKNYWRKILNKFNKSTNSFEMANEKTCYVFLGTSVHSFPAIRREI